MKHTVFLMLVFMTTGAYGQDVFNKAKSLLAGKDTAGAVTAFGDALKAGQKTAESNYYLGAIALVRNSVDDAIRYLDASVQQDDDNLDAVKGLGTAYLKKKNGPKALETFRLASSIAPKDCEIAIAYGRALLEADSVDAAVINLTKAKECAPNDASIFEGLGDAYLKQGVNALAISNYDQSVKAGPQNIEVRYKLARAYEKNRQYTEAVKVYDDIIAIDPANTDAYFQKGSILVRAKLYPRAVEPLKKFVELKPNSYEGNSMLAKSLLESKKSEDAVKYAQNALALDSSSADVWRTYFYGLVETKDYARAEAALASLQRRGKIEVDDYLKLGDLYFGKKEREKALEWYLKAVAADSSNCDPYFNLGFLYMQGQEYANAAVNFEKKITCDSNSLSAYVNAAASHMQTKNNARARELLVRAIERKPDFFQGRLWLARYYVQVDSFDNAKKEYEEVLRLIGDNTEKYKKEAGEAHSLLASLYSTRQQFDQAIEEYRRAAGVGYDNGGMRLSWGQAVLQTLNPKTDSPEQARAKNDEAVKHFRRCIELEPNNADGHLWLAESLTRSRVPGDDARNAKLKEEACSEYRRTLKIQPKNEDAKKGLEKLGC